MTDPNEVSADEMLLASAEEIDALIEVLVRKGIVTRQELLDEIHVIRQRMQGGDHIGSA